MALLEKGNDAEREASEEPGSSIVCLSSFLIEFELRGGKSEIFASEEEE